MEMNNNIYQIRFVHKHLCIQLYNIYLVLLILFFNNIAQKGIPGVIFGRMIINLAGIEEIVYDRIIPQMNL